MKPFDICITKGLVNNPNMNGRRVQIETEMQHRTIPTEKGPLEGDWYGISFLASERTGYLREQNLDLELSVDDPAFQRAYTKATDAMREAIMDFERATGRIVDTIELVKIDVSTIESSAPKTIRQTALHFLPKPGEVSW
jgi:hypothetical protein